MKNTQFSFRVSAKSNDCCRPRPEANVKVIGSEQEAPDLRYASSGKRLFFFYPPKRKTEQ